MNKIKRIAFAGTPEFARAHLDVLIDQGYEVCCVFTQPDRPKGRGRKVQISPVKDLAQAHGIDIFQPTSLKKETDYHEKLRELAPDLLIVVAYGLILPQAFLDIPKLGSWNVHASLLPRWRGAAPIQRAIMAGDTQTGITIMQMDAGLDTGDMLLKNHCDISPCETAASLHDKFLELGPQTLLEALRRHETLKPEKQASDNATYAHKLKKSEAKIDWRQDVTIIDRHIRAFYPWPVCETSIHEQTIRIWQARIVDPDFKDKPGKIIQIDQDAVLVAANPGLLALMKIQLPNKKPLSIRDLRNGHLLNFSVGECFEP